MNEELYYAALNEIDSNMKSLEHSNDPYYAALDAVDSEILKHHGVLGMKWGIRRYQNPDGTLTALGRQHLEDGKTQKVIDKWNQRKEIAIKKGDKKFINKNLDMLSDEDINRFSQRFTNLTTIRELQNKASQVTKDKIDNWAGKAMSIVNMVSNGVEVYNSMARVVNAFKGKDFMKVLKEPTQPPDDVNWTSRTVTYEQDGKKFVEIYGKGKGGKG